MNNIVGIQSGHDVSYSILKNGMPLIHEELERFSRVKKNLEMALSFFRKNYQKTQKNSKFFTLGNFSARDRERWPKCNDFNSESLMNMIIDQNNGKYLELSHHMCHAANAFFSSNFNEALILTIDGGGMEDKETLTACTIYEGKGFKIKKIKVYDFFRLNIAGGWNLFLNFLVYLLVFLKETKQAP